MQQHLNQYRKSINQSGASCVNTIGSYKCVNDITTITCPNGYEKVGNQCKDIDECETGAHNCNLPSQRCINRPGTYDCFCEYSFRDKFLGECLDFDNVCQTPDACRKNEVCEPTTYENGNKLATGISCTCPRENGVAWVQQDPNCVSQCDSICVRSKLTFNWCAEIH